MIINNRLKLNKSKIYDFLLVLPWVVIFTTFSVIMSPDIVKLGVEINYGLLLFLFVLSNLALLVFLLARYELTYLARQDILILGVFLIQFALVFKNYANSGVLRNTWLIYSCIFYFMGRAANVNSFFTIKYFIKGVIIGAVFHVIASILLKSAFLLGNVNLILVGADIVGFQWHGYFINRATGFFTSPLTLSGFLLIALMLLTYFVLEQRRLYGVYVFILIGFLLTMSRGSFIAFLTFNLIILFLKPRLIYDRVVLAIIVLSSMAMIFAVSRGIVSFDRIFSKASFAISYDTRIKNHVDHLVQWTSNPISLFLGDASNQLGIDSDFLNYVFSMGLIISLFYVILAIYLLFFIRNNVFGTYLSAGFLEKIIDSMLSGSSLGPPTLFAVMYLIGFWISIGYSKHSRR